MTVLIDIFGGRYTTRYKTKAEYIELISQSVGYILL
ncbi:hypothetical protein TMEN_5309 [Trichophyton mentagrophytes]|nr:hypothetical protein TMEN_5309 [Trichophyton mentagrophytes]